MLNWTEFIAKKNHYKHHAFLLISKKFEQNHLSDQALIDLFVQFCHLPSKIKSINIEEVISHPDVFIVDRSRKIIRREDVELLRERVSYPPVIANRRLFIIDHCPRMNANAANALLKILEEPPSPALFILTCANVTEVLPTIASRIQKIFITFTENNTTDKADSETIFQNQDLEWITKHIHTFSFFNTKTHSAKKIFYSALQLKNIIDKAEKLSKENNDSFLQDLIITATRNILLIDPKFMPEARRILSFIRQWKEQENFNLSTKLWLIKILLSDKVS